jgi:hypothetical protein
MAALQMRLRQLIYRAALTRVGLALVLTRSIWREAISVDPLPAANAMWCRLRSRVQVTSIKAVRRQPTSLSPVRLLRKDVIHNGTTAQQHAAEAGAMGH